MTPISGFERMGDASTELLTRIDNPLHVAIVQNYRRHCWMEMAQRWEEILSPEMMGDNPVYHLSAFGMDREIVGRDAVRELYSGMHFQSYPVNERVAVNDWGIASEAYQHQYVTGASLDEMNIKYDGSPTDWFDLQYEMAMVWHYTDKGLFIGENIYAQA